MKWVFLALLSVFVPFLTAFLRSQPRFLAHTCFCIGLLPFAILPYLYVAPISWAGWAGPVKGVEVSLLDGVSLAVILATPSRKIPAHLKFILGLIFLAVVVSTAVSAMTMPAMFYAWQLFRSVLLFIAVFRLCAVVPNGPILILTGLGLGLLYEAFFATLQYAQGVPRPGGKMGHSNFLGLSSSLVTFPALALLLGGRKVLIPALAVLAGLMISVVGGSRATLGLFVIGSSLTFALSIYRRRTSRKIAFASVMALVILLSTPLMFSVMSKRSAENTKDSDLERSSMKLAARMIIADHPLGVGGDQYVNVANLGGYSERANVPWVTSSRSAPVHDTYYLVTPELGFLGLVALLSLLASLIFTGFRALARNWDEQTSEAVPGLLASMIIFAVHISYEWAFMHFIQHYLFAIDAAILVSLAVTSKAAAVARRPSVTVVTATGAATVPSGAAI